MEILIRQMRYMKAANSLYDSIMMYYLQGENSHITT